MTPNRLLDFCFFISLHLKNSPVPFHRSGKKVSSSFLRKSGFENGLLCHCKKPANFRSSEGLHRFWVTGSSLDAGWLLDSDIGSLGFYRTSFLALSTVVHTLFSSGAQQDLLWLTLNCGVWKEGRGLAKPHGCPFCCGVRVWPVGSCDVLTPFSQAASAALSFGFLLITLLLSVGYTALCGSVYLGFQNSFSLTIPSKSSFLSNENQFLYTGFICD